jgi:hypothetical protein
MAITPHELRRWILWSSVLQHRAVLPWVRTCRRFAQAAEDPQEWRRLGAREAQLAATITGLEAELWAMDYDWACVVLGRWYAVHADGTPDPTRRLK